MIKLWAAKIKGRWVKQRSVENWVHFANLSLLKNRGQFFHWTLEWLCLLCSSYKLLSHIIVLYRYGVGQMKLIIPKGVSDTAKQLSHINNFIVNKNKLKPLK